MFFNILYIFIFLLLAPIFLLKSCVSSNFRKIFFYRLKASFLAPQALSSGDLCNKSLIWIHAASVGEVELVRHLINHLAKQWQFPYFITTNTLGGLAQAKKFNPNSFIAPLDFSCSIQNWLKKIKIKGLVLIEAEIWYNTILLASKKCPVALVNGRVQKQKGLNRMLYQMLLKRFSLVLASNQSSYDFYLSLSKNTAKKADKSQTNKTKIAYSGNLKFASSVATTSNSIQKKALQKSFQKVVQKTPKRFLAKNKNAKLFLAASLQPEELPIILDAYFQAQQKISSLYLALIPRHLEKTDLFLKNLPKNTQIITEQKKRIAENVSQKILFIPLLGILKDWYAEADAVFVGGSLCARGGQNMIEPLSLGVPTATGYNTKNFEFAMQLFLPAGSICEVYNTKELTDFIVKSIQKPNSFKKGLATAQKIIAEQSSSLAYTVQELKKLFAREN